MNYQKQQIKEGINLHTIQTNKFKTNLLSVFLTMPLSRDLITKEALIAQILRRGSNLMPSSEEISITLEEMYGASFNCGIEKIGENHIIKFYLETINDEFLPKKEDMLQKGLNTLFEIIFNPLIENSKFNEEYVLQEKDNLKQIIEGKKDDKARYALERTTEEMYKDKPYGLYKYGFIEDIEKINSENLYNCYQNMINTCKIDIFVSGNIDINNTKTIIEQSELIKNLHKRKYNKPEEQLLQLKKEPKEIKEDMDITQGKMVIGLTIETKNLDEKYVALVYNTILGGGANSKLFQNVREKASLAYTAGSNYLRQMNNIFIRCGIEVQNYEKALNIIKKQLEDIRNGEFTKEDIQNAKQNIISTIKFIPDEQDTGITYCFGQELSGNYVSFEEYENKIKAITKEQIIELANKINIDTIYFLTSKK